MIKYIRPKADEIHDIILFFKPYLHECLAWIAIVKAIPANVSTPCAPETNYGPNLSSSKLGLANP